MADREQIGQNKTDIAGLVEGMTDLAPEIHNTAPGSVITADDAAEGRPFWGLRVFGKSTQRTTTGAQLLSIKQEDVANKDGLSAKVNVDGGITVTGTPDKQYATIYGKDIILSPGKYYLNGGNGSAGAVLLKARITFSDGSSKNCANGSFEVTPDTKSVSILIQYESATIQSVNYTIYPMLNKGETALPFEPYTGGKPSPSPEYPQEIVGVGESGNITVEVRGKNLLQLQDGRGGSRGVEVTCRNGEISLVGTATETGWTISEVNPPFVLNGDYALSTSNDVGCYLINNDYKTVISTLKPQNIVNGEVTKIAFGVTEGKIYNMNGIKVMLNRGLTASPYEPPRIPQSLTLQTPNGLPGIPVSKDGNYTDADGQQWICDEIDLERGKYVQRVKEVNPADYDDWILDDSTEPIRFKVNRIPDTINERKRFEVLSNRFVFNSENKVGVSFAYADEIYFYLPSTVTTVEQAKQWFVDNPTTLMYMLGTPIEINLTPEEIAAYKALRTYGPTTVITNDAGAGMEVTYVADTKTYIDNKFAALNKAVLDAVGGT